MFLLYFWIWWLRPEHNIGAIRYSVVTLAIGWLSFLQLYFLAIFLRAKKPVNSFNGNAGARVAMIVTKTPSEPFEIVRITLQAMLAQDYPHDTWLADEDPQTETIDWCNSNGVRISTRKNCAAYHQKDWPRRTRCKEGNLAYFYDHYGYRQYDFVSQLDADHVPNPGFLQEILRPFVDPNVGYVTAPSICSRNAADSWSARTRLFSEAAFHGALQAGYTNGWAPMCIGSHYAVRTRALEEIGGLGPELAEDHSTALIMNSHGWKGVHALDALAIGDGPATFGDMLTQEFQWSRSLMTIFLRYTPRYLAGLPPKLKFQFVFSQLWYPIFAAFMLMTYLLPIVALTFDMPFAGVTYPAFLGHAAPATLVLMFIAYEIRRDGLLRPQNAKVISWERALFACAQWPWVLWGSLVAIRDRLFGTTAEFRITPKGQVDAAKLPFKALLPYLLLATGAVCPLILIDDAGNSAGFYLFSLANAAIYTLLFTIAATRHLVENGIGWKSAPLHHGIQFASASLLVALVLSSGWMRGTESIHYLATGLEPLQITQEVFAYSGAGNSSKRDRIFAFELNWNEQFPGEFK